MFKKCTIVGYFVEEGKTVYFNASRCVRESWSSNTVIRKHRINIRAESEHSCAAKTRISDNNFLRCTEQTMRVVTTSYLVRQSSPNGILGIRVLSYEKLLI